MPRVDLHIPQAAGWRALLTEAQSAAQSFLPEAVEEHLVALLYRALGQPAVSAEQRALGYAQQLLENGLGGGEDIAAVGDQCLLFAGLFPEHAIRKGILITYFVQVGRSAYLEYAAAPGGGRERAVYREIAEAFVPAMDVLQTLRERDQNAPCIDAMNAYHLWQETGSRHAWHVLQRLSASLPAAALDSGLRH